MPAQPLGNALLALGRQSGLEISFPPAAVVGKMAPALHGEYSALLALDRLLAGSGLALRADGPGRYIVFIDKANPFSTSRLEPVRVYGEQTGERIFDKEEIATTPSSNHDLSTLVANHPAVRTNPGAAGSQNRGSLNVEDISFHGASPYQNLFQIDGIDATNRVDPASKNLNLQVGNVPSNPQSYFIDTSLLESVRVYDSFVPVEYGRFTGGVVDARLRRFSGENHLKF
ncbi:TonB-dependent receptor plug domain-containing protein, partial [Achromobacter xylosoxidans]